MPRQQENLQRDRQLDQDVHPTSSSNSARSTTRRPRQDTLLTLNMAPLRVLRADVITLLHGNRADKIALLRARRAFIYAHCREKGAEVYALPPLEETLLRGFHYPSTGLRDRPCYPHAPYTISDEKTLHK